MASVNKVDISNMYLVGMLSIPEIAAATSTPVSTVRNRLIKMGVKLRSRSEGLRVKVGLGSHRKGKSRSFTVEWKANIRAAALMRGERCAKGTSLKPNGYLEYTRGPHKGRGVHVVRMEAFLGRKLVQGECTHHVDGNRTNNRLDNLELMTRSSHARLHRLLDTHKRERGQDGRFR